MDYLRSKKITPEGEVEVSFLDLEEGDQFRMYQPDGVTPFAGGLVHTAEGRGFLDKDGLECIVSLREAKEKR